MPTPNHKKMPPCLRPPEFNSRLQQSQRWPRRFQMLEVHDTSGFDDTQFQTRWCYFVTDLRVVKNWKFSQVPVELRISKKTMWNAIEKRLLTFFSLSMKWIKVPEFARNWLQNRFLIFWLDLSKPFRSGMKMIPWNSCLEKCHPGTGFPREKK